MVNSSQYRSDFRKYTPSDYRVERTTPLKLSLSPSMKRAAAAGAVRSVASTTIAIASNGLQSVSVPEDQDGEEGTAAAVKCSSPLDNGQLQQGHFPPIDWAGLIQSLWAPWCGFWFTGAMVLVEADGPARTLVATADPGVLYTRGYPKPE